MAWRSGELFKLKKQNGRCWQASFAWEKSRWISTKEHDRDKAVEWCESYVVRQGRSNGTRPDGSGEKMLFGQFASGFFSDADPMGYRKRRTALGKSGDERSYRQKQGRLDNYIMPRFRNMAISDISVVMVEDWYTGLEGVRTGTLLCSGARLAILKTLSIILDEAVRLQLIGYNPCDKVELIRLTTSERRTFSQEQLEVMFPKSPLACIGVWGDVQTALYFSIAIDTGWRAGEILALSSRNWYPEERGIYSTMQVNTVTGTVKDSVKTAHTGGYRYRIGFLSERSARLLEMLPERNRLGCFFSCGGGQSGFISYDTMLRRLKSVMREVVKAEDWNSYTIHCFRHTFMTRLVSVVDEPTMLKLMGHTSYRREYDHSSAAQRFHEVESARMLIPGI